MIKHIDLKPISDIIICIFIVENNNYNDNGQEDYGMVKVRALLEFFNKIEVLKEDEIFNFSILCANIVCKYFNIVDGESMLEIIIGK